MAYDEIRMFVVDLGARDDDSDIILKLAALPQKEFIESLMASYDSLGKSATQQARRAYERDQDSPDVAHLIRLAFRMTTLNSILKHAFIDDPAISMDIPADSMADINAAFANLTKPKNADKAHSTITKKRVMRAARHHMMGGKPIGFCLHCGNSAEVDAHAQRVECDNCGAEEVYGNAEVLLQGMFHADKPT